jgi:hypothetical protein
LFLGTTILATTFFSFTTGATFLALSFSVLISMLFVGLSRIRANQIGLRLPDILGIEAPIAVGMIGLVLVHVAGRASNSVVELGDASHLLIFIGGLTMLAGLGLLGRNDLGMRIPNAVEGVIYLAVLDRVLSILVGGEVPIPFATNPFEGTFLVWTLPLIGIETLAVIAVLIFDWVEGKRIQHKLPDHRGAGGRTVWMVMIAMLSFGPAGIIVLALSARRGAWWTQPAVVLMAWLLIPFVYQSAAIWLADALTLPLPRMGIVATSLGLISVAFVAWTVQARQGLWLPAGLWAMHLLLIGSSFGHGNLLFAVFFILLASTVSWVTGVLTLRKAWRVVGALDLVLSWILAAVIIIQGAAVEVLLGILIASAILLGLVTYLTQTHEGEMANE